MRCPIPVGPQPRLLRQDVPCEVVRPMTEKPVLITGAGHLALRIRRRAAAQGYRVLNLSHDAVESQDRQGLRLDAMAHALGDTDLDALSMAFLVDDRDGHNLELVTALISRGKNLPIVVSLFNENIAPHLQAAHPRIKVLNPARVAAPAFIGALHTPLTHELRYEPAKIHEDRTPGRVDRLIGILMAAFLGLVVAATSYFHVAEHLSWLNASYFVVVTIATVGYGDISLLNSSTVSKLVGIGLIVGSTAFIWVIFSLTVDNIIKKRVQLALGRRKYSRKGHVILCGLGRLGYFIGEGLLRQGERVLIVEKNEHAAAIDHFRSLGADVYIGDARLPRVLQDVGVMRAKALYSVVDNDLTNLEIGLNGRSFAPNLRLVLRIFDESMSERIKEDLDIHLSFSVSAIVAEEFFSAVTAGK